MSADRTQTSAPHATTTAEPGGEYHSLVARRFSFLILSFLLLFFLLFYSLSVGPIELSIQEVFSSLLGRECAEITHRVVWDIRLVRALTAIVAGISLSVAGAVMQNILRNPLGSPFTLGISHAAAFGAAFAIIVFGAGTFTSGSKGVLVLNNPYIVTISAFFWSLSASLIIFMLAKLKKATPESMILLGVALGSLFMAGITAMQYFANDVQLSAMIFWTFGDMGRASWRDLWIMSGVTLPTVIYFLRKSWDYNVMNFGDEVAKSLGVEVERTRLYGMLFASLVTAVTISIVGIIGFVGLVVPHIVRKIIGGDERFLIPASCLFGGVLLLASDTAARTVISPIVLPVGLLTSFMGAPLFIYLVMKEKSYRWY